MKSVAHCVKSGSDAGSEAFPVPDDRFLAQLTGQLVDRAARNVTDTFQTDQLQFTQVEQWRDVLDRVLIQVQPPDGAQQVQGLDVCEAVIGKVTVFLPPLGTLNILGSLVKSTSPSFAME